jgi:hypothetical protein
MAFAARPVEEPQYCLQVMPPRVCGVVPSWQYVPRMEGIGDPGFSSMGSRERSVNAYFLNSFQRLKFPDSVAGAGKSVLWSVKLFSDSYLENLLYWQLHINRGHRCHEESGACVTSVLLL